MSHAASDDNKLLFTDIEYSPKHMHTSIFNDGTAFHCMRYPTQWLYVTWRGNVVDTELPDSISIDCTPVAFNNSIYFKSKRTICKASFNPRDGIVITHVRRLTEDEWINPRGLCTRVRKSHESRIRKYVYRLFDDPKDGILIDASDSHLAGSELAAVHRGMILYVKRGADTDQPLLHWPSSYVVLLQLPISTCPPRAWSHESSTRIYVSNGQMVCTIDIDNVELLHVLDIVKHHIISIAGVFDDLIFAHGFRYKKRRELFCFMAAQIPIISEFSLKNEASTSSLKIKRTTSEQANSTTATSLGATSKSLDSPTQSESSMLINRRLANTSKPLPNITALVRERRSVEDRRKQKLETLGRESVTFTSRFKSEFMIEKLVGSSAFGKVFQVKHLYDEETYAVKRISIMHSVEKIIKTLGENCYQPNGSSDEFHFEHFASENVVFIYIQMEFGKESLEDWLNRSTGRRSKEQMKSWFKQIVLALQYIHSNNLFHRDLKPSNILVVSEDVVKICDLGIATYSIIDDGETSLRWRSNIGTHMYKAPEQNYVYDEKVDIFSIGLILLELCIAMTEKQKTDIFLNIRTRRPLSILRDRPAALDLIMKLTKSDKDLRPSFDEILNHAFFSD